MDEHEAGMAKVRTARRAADVSVPQADKSAVHDDLQLWRLDTRYYTAELRLLQLPQTAEAATIEASVQSKLPRGACDAFLLLCDTAEADIGAKLRAWQTPLEALGPSVQLCVASARGPNQHEGNVRVIEEWCTENAVELILWNPLDEGSGGEATGGLLSERQGLERVLEALEANMWPVMSMKPRTAFARPIALPDEESALEDDQQPETKQSGTAERMSEISAEAVSLKKDEEPHANGAATEDAEEEWTEDIDEHFEKAFKQLAGVREMRQQSAQLSDQQRRDFAADAALALARAFGLNLEDDSDDSD